MGDREQTQNKMKVPATLISITIIFLFVQISDGLLFGLFKAFNYKNSRFCSDRPQGSQCTAETYDRRQVGGRCVGLCFGKGCIYGECHECRNDRECGGSYYRVCNTGQCRTRNCSTNGDCVGDKYCSSGLCYTRSSSSSGSSSNSCVFDSSCTGSQTCSFGRCSFG